jgi:hypothetical protein
MAMGADLHNGFDALEEVDVIRVVLGVACKEGRKEGRKGLLVILQIYDGIYGAASNQKRQPPSFLPSFLPSAYTRHITLLSSRSTGCHPIVHFN